MARIEPYHAPSSPPHRLTRHLPRARTTNSRPVARHPSPPGPRPRQAIRDDRHLRKGASVVDRYGPGKRFRVTGKFVLVYRENCAGLPENVCWFTGKCVLVYRKMCAGLPVNVCWFTGKCVLVYRKMCADSWRWQAERSFRHGDKKNDFWGTWMGGGGWSGLGSDGRAMVSDQTVEYTRASEKKVYRKKCVS